MTLWFIRASITEGTFNMAVSSLIRKVCRLGRVECCQWQWNHLRIVVHAVAIAGTTDTTDTTDTAAAAAAGTAAAGTAAAGTAAVGTAAVGTAAAGTAAAGTAATTAAAALVIIATGSFVMCH